MSQTNDGPAFPTYPPHGFNEPHRGTTGGMSLRDYFAGQALTGMIHDLGDEESEHPADWDEFNAGIVANAAYRFADAMLKAREGK